VINEQAKKALLAYKL